MSFQNIAADVSLGSEVYLADFINLYGCTIGNGCKIGAFVEIQRHSVIGNNCKISSHSFICEGVTIEDNVFIGHGVIFINDRHPHATNTDGSLQNKTDWKVIPTIVKRGASIGSGCTIMCGITIGEQATIGAGSIVLHDVLAGETVAGNPAKNTRGPNHVS